jgi:hypothetical protein
MFKAFSLVHIHTFGAKFIILCKTLPDVRSLSVQLYHSLVLYRILFHIFNPIEIAVE